MPSRPQESASIAFSTTWVADSDASPAETSVATTLARAADERSTEDLKKVANRIGDDLGKGARRDLESVAARSPSGPAILFARDAGVSGLAVAAAERGGVGS